MSFCIEGAKLIYNILNLWPRRSPRASIKWDSLILSVDFILKPHVCILSTKTYFLEGIRFWYSMEGYLAQNGASKSSSFKNVHSYSKAIRQNQTLLDSTKSFIQKNDQTWKNYLKKKYNRKTATNYREFLSQTCKFYSHFAYIVFH